MPDNTSAPLSAAAIDAAARHLVAARTTGRPAERLASELRPADASDAIAIQQRVAKMLRAPIGGWKCSLPSAGKTIVAPIFADLIHDHSPVAVHPVDAAAAIEPEIACVLARDLPARAAPYTEDEVRAAVGEVRLVLELVGCRYADAANLPFVEMLADNGNNQGLYVGPVVADAWQHSLAAFALTVSGAEGPMLSREGRHPDGHPLRPLVWLADELGSARWGGRGLEAGQIVTTGSYAGVLGVPFATSLAVRFGDLGTIDVEFRRRDQAL
jgi:2-keto-4-pentenoate hydratase